jgi:hypothetical protein
MEACERLLSTPGLPTEIEGYARQNQTYYLPKLSELVTEYTADQIIFPVRDGWSRFNPSVAVNPAGDIRCVVRSSNYAVDDRLRYDIHDPEGVIRTRNYLLSVFPGAIGCSTGDQYFIEDEHFQNLPPPYPVSGFEDARLYWRHGRWHLLTNVRDRDERGIAQQATLRLNQNTVVGMTLLEPAQHDEKNWMPIGNGREAVRSCNPLIVLVCGARGEGRFGVSPHIARSFRGGSQLVPMDDPDRQLAIIHEPVNFAEPPVRVYQHRFVEFDAWMPRITRISRPFMFHKRGIEFAAGLAIVGEELIVSYGVDDAEAWLMKLPLTDAMALLIEPYPEDLPQK